MDVRSAHGPIAEAPPLVASGDVVVEDFLDTLCPGGADPLVEVQGLPQESNAFCGVAELEVAAAAASECLCVLKRAAEVANDGERFGAAREAVFRAERGCLQCAQVSQGLGLAGPVADLPIHSDPLGQRDGGGLVVTGEVLQ